MRIEVLFLRVMLFWYYGSELAVADTSRPEGHHASRILDLYIKCLDPADNMNVIRAHRILSLATTPTEESDEALGQVTGDHVLGQMNLVRTQSIPSLAQTPTEESDEALDQVHTDHRGEMNDASHTDSDTPSPQSVRPKPQPVRTGSTPVGVRSTRERERQPSLSRPVEWLHSHPWWQSAMQEKVAKAPGHHLALWACLVLYAGFIGLGAALSALLGTLGVFLGALLGMFRKMGEHFVMLLKIVSWAVRGLTEVYAELVKGGPTTVGVRSPELSRRLRAQLHAH